MALEKLVLKDSCKMTLHERFTQLKFTPRKDPPIVQRQTVISPTQTAAATRRTSRPSYQPQIRSRTPDLPRYSARERSFSPVARMRSSAPSSRYGGSVAASASRYGGSSTLLAANRIKKKSVYLRLGVRPGSAGRMAARLPTWAEPYTSPRSWFGRRSNSTPNLNRWNSQGSLNSYNNGPRYQTNRFRGYWGRRGRGNNRSRRGRFGYGGRFGGQFNRRWRGQPRGRKAPPPNKEDLDKELDSYMEGTRGRLNQELDVYMEERK